METFLLNLLKTSLLGSLAILAMLVLKPLWRERYRAKTRCWLWLAYVFCCGRCSPDTGCKPIRMKRRRVSSKNAS